MKKPSELLSLDFKLLQINLVSQNIVGSEVKDSYEYEFFNNTTLAPYRNYH